MVFGNSLTLWKWLLHVGGIDHCHGDSGAPLMFYDSKIKRFVQVGMAVGGFSDCGSDEYPGVNIRLQDPQIYTFIKKHTVSTQYELDRIVDEILFKDDKCK